ncbi:hypothetical protein [Halobacteriovorax sp. JY17]|uniref:hypothetical protein n=1 Tax=Halobacteriovorax sp. JY17 TaxID=2014617 RepID=UPI000C5705A7|nr:hypothetical protein [Halobacteriovorax sp. JY17]PIK13954.1 MAG: hypothetical protein CES88_13290 [Halobacteriovorax sp. JY17]
MKRRVCKNLTGRLNFRQKNLVNATMLICAFVSINSAFGQSSKDNSEMLSNLNPYKKVATRAPSNFVPDVEASDRPNNVTLWYENILVEDTAGVMKGMRETYDSWEQVEEYATNWNVASTGLYEIRDQEDRQKYFNKYILKYLDKRLSGEIKQAEEGSTLHRVGKVQKALKPQTAVQVSRNLRFKFKARVLQGKALMFVENPWINNETSVKLDGRINLNVNKDIAALGLKANFDYDVKHNEYEMRLDRPLTEEITARVSTAQKRDIASTGQTVELLFNKEF